MNYLLNTLYGLKAKCKENTNPKLIPFPATSPGYALILLSSPFSQMMFFPKIEPWQTAKRFQEEEEGLRLG
jgi:hypothetical protein